MWVNVLRRTLREMLTLWVWCGMLVGSMGNELAPGTHVNEIRGYYRREHSLIKPYQGSGMDIQFWDIVGSTMVTPQYIRLTSDSQSRRGAIWNKIPVQSRDWELIVSFKVHGSTGDMFGDGMAIWYARDRGILGDVFGSMDYFHGFALFLDTYSNHNGPHQHGHPYVSAMVANGSQHYDHDRDGTHTQLGGDGKGCEAKFRNKDYETSVLIRYAADTISVYTDIHQKGIWDPCFTVPQVKLPSGYFFGVSAATGELTDNHDFISARVYELDVMRAEKEGETNRQQIEPEAAYYAAPRDHVADPKPSKLSGLKTFVLVIVAIVGVVLFLGIGYVLFQKRQEQSRKRFY